MRLLCVEDEAHLREDMVEFLRMKSFEVDEAANGEDAIEQINRNHYDLVLCDIKMPHMDGYELLRQVRGENHLATTPFIFLSALNERSDKMRAHQSGCDGYLTKPIDFSLLETTLKSHIERQRARDFLLVSTLESSRRQTMAALDDALNGSVSESCLIIDELKKNHTLMTPESVAHHLARLEDLMMNHSLKMHALHSALQLQVTSGGLMIEAVTVDTLIHDAVDECNHTQPLSTITYDASPKNANRSISVDTRLMQCAVGGLLAAMPYERSSAMAISTDFSEHCWTLTVSDHPTMNEDVDFSTIDETLNLTTLANVTRQRLVPLLYAMQVAHAHGGRMELKIWPGDHLAVRFVLPYIEAAKIAA